MNILKTNIFTEITNFMSLVQIYLLCVQVAMRKLGGIHSRFDMACWDHLLEFRILCPNLLGCINGINFILFDLSVIYVQSEQIFSNCMLQLYLCLTN